MNILADASLPALNSAFPPPFQVETYSKLEDVPTLLAGKTIILCRSTLKIPAGFLGKNHSIRYVATASSGIDHIDQAYLEEEGIQLLDAKGCNALAVADYITATLAYLMKHKEMKPRQAGVIGVGEVGRRVVKRLRASGLNTLLYDPLRAIHDLSLKTESLESLLACDVITVHANLHQQPPYSSYHLINQSFLSQLAPNTVLINAARGEIVDEAALLANIQKIIYCSDVYAKEPSINEKIIEQATLCTPHIAGHSLEAKERAVRLLSEQLCAIYKLPTPLWQPARCTPCHEHDNWQDSILSLYNPFHETSLLKKAENKRNCFLELRRAHQFRHDFYLHASLEHSCRLRSLLGAVDNCNGLY